MDGTVATSSLVEPNTAKTSNPDTRKSLNSKSMMFQTRLEPKAEEAIKSPRSPDGTNLDQTTEPIEVQSEPKNVRMKMSEIKNRLFSK